MVDIISLRGLIFWRASLSEAFGNLGFVCFLFPPMFSVVILDCLPAAKPAGLPAGTC